MPARTAVALHRDEAMTGCEAKTGSRIAADANVWSAPLASAKVCSLDGRVRLAALGVAAFLILGSVVVGARSTSARRARRSGQGRRFAQRPFPERSRGSGADDQHGAGSPCVHQVPIQGEARSLWPI